MINPLNFITKFIKSGNQRELEKIQKTVLKINELENKVSNFKDSDFPNNTKLFKEKIINGESLDNILPLGFAMVREASKRCNKERHFDVQLIGGHVLCDGKIAEMKTGEGKTLTIVLAAYLNALKGKGVHVVTVNDYLAKRDCENMGVIYNFLGLTCGFINAGQSDEERKKNYNCDITYATQ
jgi:Preprotein translocase subunit SecA (ATPase, RNA helicase)